MKFIYEVITGWPSLAWIARFEKKIPEIRVRHGSRVETRADWFCEAVWNGSFPAGDIDRTDVVFGSGCRLRDDRAVLVTSGSVADRLHYAGDGSTWHVSNSLSCLAAALDLEFDPWYPYYYEDFFSITRGIGAYKREVGTSKGPVNLVYFDNLVWDGGSIRIHPKPLPERDFSNFEAYRGFLDDQLRALAANMRDASRRWSYEPISMASSGYDSLAATVLTREIGNEEVICFTEDRLDRDDSGAKAVERLGLRPLVYPRDAWRRQPCAEIPFIAADACGRDSILVPARDVLPQRVLFSGCHGGAVWGKWPPQLGTNLERADNQGLSLTDFRLQAGALHCPTPAIGARQCPDIVAISQSEAMQSWSIGGRYDRPIPRRIIEQAGVPRDMFGRLKTASSLHLFSVEDFNRYMPGSESFRDYMTWIRRKSKESRPAAEYDLELEFRQRIDVPLFRHLFPWAIERAKTFYRRD